MVITGLSGSGKSSLAFDTIYAEGQRRYVESLSAYARQFLGQMEKPDVDQIDGLSPAISIDQKGASRNPRSTVGTVTEIYDHLRLLFARIGHPHCPVCGREIERQTVQQIVDQVYALPEGSRLLVLGPLIKDRKTEGDRVFEAARKQGFVRVRVDGEQVDLADVTSLDKYKRHTIEVVVDRFVVRRGGGTPARRPPDAARLADSVETALRLGEGVVVIAPAARDGETPAFEEHRYSERYSCPYDGTTIDELEPRSFSFNSPHGACPDLHRDRDPARDRPGPGDPGPGSEHRGRRPGAVVPDADRRELADEDPRGDLRRARLGHPACRSAISRRRPSSTSSTPPRRRRSSSPTSTSAARTPTRRRSRASSRTSSGATGRPTPSTSRRSSRSTWSPGRARRAAASGCGRRPSA